MIVDATDAVLGRLASRVAKRLLNGEEITVVNAKKIVISGTPRVVKERFLKKVQRGSPFKGPFYPKKPAMLTRRVIRGMIPHKKKKGSDALKKLRVHEDCPDQFKNLEKISKTSKDLRHKYITLETLCERIGG